MNQIAENPEITRAAWLEERKSYLGASECAAVLNLSPYSSAHEVWLVKRGLFEVPETLAMRRGLAMEPFIASEYELLTGIKPRPSTLYRNEKFPFMACNPDREVTVNGMEGLLELKDVSFWPGQQWGADGADSVPAHYLTQAMFQLMVTRKQFVQLVACLDGREVKIYSYTFDAELFAGIGLFDKDVHVFDKEAARAAWSHCIDWWDRHVVGGIEPPMTGLQTDHDWVQHERSTYENGKLTNTDEEVDAVCVDLQRLMKETKDAKLKETEAKNRIKLFMVHAKADTLESTVGTFTYRTNKAGVSSLLTPFKSGAA